MQQCYAAKACIVTVRRIESVFLDSDGKDTVVVQQRGVSEM
jgi:hypothetical protein